MIGDESDWAVSVFDSQTVVTAGESYFSQDCLIKHSLILIDELVVTVNGSILIDQLNRVIWQITCVWKFYVVEINAEIQRSLNIFYEWNVREVLLFA